jgi:TDG/mug DNA glycosylase family protein
VIPLSVKGWGPAASKIVAPPPARYRTAMPAVRHASFAPHVHDDTRLLILGSLPGARSLAERQYYAHPTNQFWRLLGEVIGQPLAARPYDDRLEMLREARVGLWDVIRTAERRTSSDSEIREVEAHDLAALVAGLPDLRLIAFNGGKAAAIGRRQLPALDGVAVVDLPSSSAANTGSYAAKRERWMQLRDAPAG